jgi:hypothetical protein
LKGPFASKTRSARHPGAQIVSRRVDRWRTYPSFEDLRSVIPPKLRFRNILLYTLSCYVHLQKSPFAASFELGAFAPVPGRQHLGWHTCSALSVRSVTTGARDVVTRGCDNITRPRCHLPSSRPPSRETEHAAVWRENQVFEASACSMALETIRY